MQLHSSTHGALDDVIQACDASVRRQARWYARWSGAEVDDLYSVGMLAICSSASRALALESPAATVSYLCKSASYAMIDELKRARKHAALSLDAPFLIDGDEAGCLLDRVAARELDHDEIESDSVRTLTHAIGRLTARQQQAVKRVYGFEGYGDGGSHAVVGRELGITAGAVGYHVTRARQALLKDAELCRVLGVEVAS